MAAPRSPHPAGPALTALCVPPAPTSPPPRPGQRQLVLQGQRIRGDRELCALCCDSALCLRLQEAFPDCDMVARQGLWDLS